MTETYPTAICLQWLFQFETLVCIYIILSQLIAAFIQFITK